MKSPRYWALQQSIKNHNMFLRFFSRNEKPEILGIATIAIIQRNFSYTFCRNEKPDIVGHRDINKKV